MKPELIWSPQAIEDTLDIYVGIGLENPDAADRIYAAIEAKASLLINYPRLGARHPEIHLSARMLVEWPYLLLYEIRPDHENRKVKYVEIVRVVDGRRDLAHLF